ncbi:MAG: ABC transporter substrate-binding protein, partial [Micrococcales bacterium]|nr:ABC transporter substrate-binding protein [Micrococcales bacterium]
MSHPMLFRAGTRGSGPVRLKRMSLSGLLVLLFVFTLLVAGQVPGAQAAQTSGGTITVLENSTVFGTWPGLDPATDTSALANQDYLNSIYGGLFQRTKTGIIPDLATGYKLASNLKTVTIHLRHGVVFSDGTPFNASAVAYSIKRDLEPQYACICRPNFPIASITTPDAYTVVLHLTEPYGPIINAFPGEAPNYIVSPTALQKMGEKAFALTPVGAGPFVVTSDAPSSKLVLKANPHYWQRGYPKLSGLTFVTVGSDQSAYAALLAGQAAVYQNFSTFTLIPQIRRQHQVRLVPVVPGSAP